MSGFGSFEVLCKEVPSYPLCNLFFRQLQKTSPSTVANATSAPVGINPVCGIPRAGTNGSLGNIANIILCALSIGAVATLIRLCSRRKAAVGRIEFRVLLLWYLLSLPLQILTTGSVLEQGSIPLVVLTAVHAGTVATLFWTLLANAIVATQVVEDGTLSSLIPFHGLALIIFTATTYISLDTAFNFTTVFISAPPTSLNNIGLFVLTSIWPAFCALAYFSIMAYVVVINLRETKPLWMLTLSLILLILSQLAYFLLSKVVCSASGAKVDGAFIATILETASVGVLFWAWRTITEDSWDEAWYPTAG